MLGVYTIVGTVDHGWGSAYTLGFGAAAVALLAGFVARQATASRPLVPLRIFRSRNVSGANVVQVLMVAGMFGMFFLGALYLQRVLGYDAVQIGAAFLPVAVGIGVLSLGFSARLITRLGARAVLLPGPRGCSSPGSSCSPARRSAATTSPTSCRRWCCSASAPASPSRRS